MSNYASWKHNVPWLRMVGLALLGVLFWRLDITAMARLVRNIDRNLLLLAVVFNLPMVLLKTLRWRVLMFPQNIYYSVSKAYLAYFGGIFIGFLTPGRLGEFVRAVHVKQDCNISIGHALSGVLADRLFDLYVLLIVGGLAFRYEADGLSRWWSG